MEDDFITTYTIEGKLSTMLRLERGFPAGESGGAFRHVLNIAISYFVPEVDGLFESEAFFDASS